MAKWETSIVVNRPVKDVFAFVTDPQQGSKWHRSNEITPISDDPIKVGSRYRVTGKFLFWKFDNETVVSEYEENRIVAYQSSSGPYPFVLRYIFEPVDNGTRLTEIGEADPPALMRLAIGLFIGTAKKNGERGLQMLKSFLEAKTA
ncbi:MAG: SRPBCC family protein [Anaerolineae bacterium]|nr:SRPBCC family protein [Anaerolineae bacterium]